MKLSIRRSEYKEIANEIQTMLDSVSVDCERDVTASIIDLPDSTDIVSRVLEFLGVDVE